MERMHLMTSATVLVQKHFMNYQCFRHLGCGLTKTEIRQLSRDAGLFTWNKFAYSCLATRIPAGEQITKEKLQIIETVENYLFSLGLSNFRVRYMGMQLRYRFLQRRLKKLLKIEEHYCQN